LEQRIYILPTAWSFLQETVLNTYTKMPARYHSLVASNPGSVLLQTSRYDAENHRSFLFFRPERTLAASSALFDEIEAALAGGSGFSATSAEKA